MLAKILKRHSSRDHLVGGNTNNKSSPSKGSIVGSSNGTHNSSNGSNPNGSVSQQQLPLQYTYQRPELLGNYSESELTQFSSHAVRPVCEPKKEKINGVAQLCPLGINSTPSVDIAGYSVLQNQSVCDQNILPAKITQSSSLMPLKCLPRGIGYAEAMNAGKSRYNEDQVQCAIGEISIPHKSQMNNNTRKAYLADKNRGLLRPIRYLYIGLFDGHGGPGVAIKASKELHQIVHEGLEDVIEYLIQCDDGYCDGRANKNTKEDKEQDQNEEEDDEDETKERKMSRDELVKGAIESAFWAMDRLILRDKQQYRISGGACTMVALFIFDKLYLANAGDSRAVCYIPGEPSIREMSFDFTPETDRQRIQFIAFQRPDLLRHPVTREKLYNRHVLSRKVGHDDIGSSIMYRDFYMSGWSARDVTADDVRLEPMITGRGKMCRLMATMGVARGIGDHGLMVKASYVSCKEFLTCQPEIRVLDLKGDYDKCLNNDAYLIMGTDGLWDVMKNSDVRDVVKDVLSLPKCKEYEDSREELGQTIARKLVLIARGERVPDMYWQKKNGELASGDDISVITISLKEAFCLTRNKPFDKGTNVSSKVPK